MAHNSSVSATSLETLVALCKRRGFVYPSADIYGGINGIYEFGHLGTLLKNNIRKAWLTSLTNKLGKVVQMEGALLAPAAVWNASGHLAGFHDPMVDCKACKRRFRADEYDLEKACPVCGKKDWTEVRNFNMMFKTNVGAMEDASSVAYLRPETAQAVFINFKNIAATARVKMPFGIAQIGKSFRNEITPKQFLFRMREFEQMELEWFCNEAQAPDTFLFWIEHRLAFYKSIGIAPEKVRIRPHEKHELAHYAISCSDVEYHFPFGWKEVEGIAYRSNFDLTQHSKHSGKDLSVFDAATNQSYIPHVVESSVGTDRLFLTLLFDSYYEDTVEDEKRIVLRFHPTIAPITLAFMPLSDALASATHELFAQFQKQGTYTCDFDDSGSIGKRYRRQDEIGTPLCITYDFQSVDDHCVTVRNRDTRAQERVSLDKLEAYIKTTLATWNQ